MSHTGRDLRSSPAIIASKEKTDDGGVAVAAGTFPPRVVGVRKPVTLDADHRAGLMDLVDAGKMLRGSDCYRNQATGKTISFLVARRLKSLDLAVAGWSKEMCASQRGKMIAKEMEDKDAAAATQPTHDPVQSDA